MIKYELEDLLNIRKIRAEKAQKELIKKKRLLEVAINDAEKKQKELEEFKRWRFEEENRIYEEIKGKLVSLDYLDNVRLKISLLREEEIMKAEAVENAKQAVREAERDCEEARKKYKQISKEVDKVEEHKSIWLEDIMKESEKKVDLDIEDFNSPSIGWKEENEWDLW